MIVLNNNEINQISAGLLPETAAFGFICFCGGSIVGGTLMSFIGTLEKGMLREQINFFKSQTDFMRNQVDVILSQINPSPITVNRV